ncbi:hypothetical protein QO004_005216 [Rhizobium mesoamericanum]|nr:hypothetical protein [Rhizobium mesoamericanum]
MVSRWLVVVGCPLRGQNSAMYANVSLNRCVYIGFHFQPTDTQTIYMDHAL